MCSIIKVSGKYSFSNDTRTKLRNSYGTLLLSSSELTRTLLFLVIALFSDQFQQAQDLLRNVEEASAQVVGLLPNAKKTKYMFFNHHVDPGIKTRDNEVIELVRTSSIWVHGSVTQSMTSRSERFQLG